MQATVKKSKWSSEKMNNQLFILKEIEKFEETENSIYGSKFQTVDEIERYRSKNQGCHRYMKKRCLSDIQVINKGSDDYDTDSRIYPC